MLEIITNNKDNIWNITLESFINYDFYDNYNIHLIDESGYEHIFIIFRKGEYKIGLPIILREIPNTKYYDITSVYGYSGPLSSHDIIPDTVIEQFEMELQLYLKKNNVVSVFSRLHPLFNQEDILQYMGVVYTLSKTVSIDLTLSIDEQRKQYRKDVKSRVNKLKRNNFVVIEDVEKEYINEFISIYNENMKRVGASAAYFFSYDYYIKLLFNDNIDARLYFVKMDEELIVGGIFVYTNEIIQYHLSGTKTAYLKESPMRLLLDYVRLIGTKEGYKYLHLGGGVGSKEDALFNFKAGFSKKRHDFKIWKYIVNKKVYDELVERTGNIVDDSYFPLYRANNKLL